MSVEEPQTPAGSRAQPNYGQHSADSSKDQESVPGQDECGGAPGSSREQCLPTNGQHSAEDVKTDTSNILHHPPEFIREENLH